MGHGSAVTGRRRIAFAVRTDGPRLPALEGLLRGLVLSQPAVCEDVVVLHPGLPDTAFDAARRVHPRVVPRLAPGRAATDPVEPPADYDTVVVLPPGGRIGGDLGPFLRSREPLVSPDPPDTACPRCGPGGADGGPMSDEEFRAAFRALPGPRHPALLVHCALPLPGPGAPPAPPGLVRAAGTALYRQGRFAEAAEVLSAAAPHAGDARLQEALGAALMALSRHEEAETHLLLATADPAVAARAYGRLAQLAWLRGKDGTAHGYAREGLDADPTDRTCRTMLGRTRPRPGGGAEPEAPRPGGRLAHVALYASGLDNAGDKLLPEAVRMCLDTDTGPRRWHPVHVHRLVDDAVLEQLNALRGVVVGGGGLFLPDTWPNGNSGWQWNVPDEALARITVPLAVFAVGFNLFQGQDYARDRLAGSLRALAERSVFFGLRNRGSVERVRELLPPSLRDRVEYQPCPTTVARHLVPGWTDPARRTGPVLLNCAFDRAGLRFGHDYPYVLAQLATAVRRLSEHGEVRYAAHAPSDEKFVHDLRREHGMTLPVDALYALDNSAVRAVYRDARLVIGMRGHATMIPFGCGTPVLSLVSHPKMAYFLEDIGRPEWGIPVHADDLAERLAARAADLLDGQDAAVADVHARQRELWRVTRENTAGLTAVFGGEAPGAAPAEDQPRAASSAARTASR
ncbi:hypothetical protein GCM10009716_25260 [Streptomyces sodiiphilus]|uniref:Polysaccharide pyruvyl transferase domain-containing protein n=1 Tax=Streptomyces sodiiphilus TaxID=226217 RepID=A0ABN2P7R5_9ACTN